MSGTQKVSTESNPAAIDKLTAEESALFDQMRADDAGGGDDTGVGEPEPRQRAEPESREPEEIDLDLEGDEPQAGRSRTVPHAQFHAANERRKAAEKKAADAEAVMNQERIVAARAAERFALLTQVAESHLAQERVQQPVVEPELPNIDIDPIGHFRELNARNERKHAAEMGELRKVVTDLSGARNQEAEINNLRSWAMPQEQAFIKAEPNYLDAAQHLRNARASELALIGMAPQQAGEQMARETADLARHCRAQGISFPELIYKISQARGFAPKAAATGTPAAGVPPLVDLDALTTPVDDAAARRAAAAARGRETSTTIATAGGNATPGRLTPEKIAEMSESDFAKVYEKAKSNPAAMRQLFGS